MGKTNNRQAIRCCLKVLLSLFCLLFSYVASAVVQFQAELTDISSTRGATFEFITVEGEDADVEVDPNGVIVLPELSDLDLVRGGALEIRPVDGSPAFSATVPMNWDGEIPLVLSFDTQSLTPDADALPRSFSNFSGMQDDSADLVIDNRSVYHLMLGLQDVRAMAQGLGIPRYVMDAAETNIRLWLLQFLLRYPVTYLGLNPDQYDVFGLLQVAQVLFGSLYINSPGVDTSGLQADECRVVNAEARRDLPVAVRPVTEDELRLQARVDDLVFSGEVSSIFPTQLRNSRVQLFAQQNPYAAVDPYWGAQDALPPIAGYVNAQNRYQLRVPRALVLGGPQHTLRNSPDRFPSTMVSTMELEGAGLDEEMINAAIEAYYRDNPMQLMVANMCDQNQVVDLDLEYLFGTD